MWKWDEEVFNCSFGQRMEWKKSISYSQGLLDTLACLGKSRRVNDIS